MPKSNFHSQFEEDRILTPERGSADTSERVLRRLILEILGPLSLWVQDHKGPIAIATIESVKKNPDLYDDAQGWKDLLEDFSGKNLELLGLKRPLELPELLRGKRNPLTDRMIELGTRTAEETLLIGWHRSHGPLALTWPAKSSNAPLPEPKIKVLIPWVSEYQDDNQEEPMALWSWDKKNFSQ